MTLTTDSPAQGDAQTRLVEELQVKVAYLSKENEELRRDKNSSREHSDESRRMMARMREELQARERKKESLESDLISQNAATKALERKLAVEKEEKERLQRVIGKMEKSHSVKEGSLELIPAAHVSEERKYPQRLKEEPVDISKADEVASSVPLKRSRSPPRESVGRNDFELNRKRLKSTGKISRPSTSLPKVDPSLPSPTPGATRRRGRKPSTKGVVLSSAASGASYRADQVPRSDMLVGGTMEDRKPKKGAAFDLPISVKEAYLKDVPSFSITPAPNSLGVKRVVMRQTYGGSDCHLVQKIPPGKNPSSHTIRQLVWPMPENSPAIPKVPGQPGLMFAARSELREGVWSTFVKDESKMTAEWLYLGEYENTLVGTLTKEQFAWQNEKVKQSWVKRVATKKSESYQAMRDRIAARNDGPVVEADIREAFESGYEGITILRMQCVGYDRTFINDVERAHNRAQAKQSKGKGESEPLGRSKEEPRAATTTRAQKQEVIASPHERISPISARSPPLDHTNENDSDSGLSYMSDT